MHTTSTTTTSSSSSQGFLRGQRSHLRTGPSCTVRTSSWYSCLLNEYSNALIFSLGPFWVCNGCSALFLWRQTGHPPGAGPGRAGGVFPQSRESPLGQRAHICLWATPKRGKSKCNEPLCVVCFKMIFFSPLNYFSVRWSKTLFQSICFLPRDSEWMHTVHPWVTVKCAVLAFII